MDPRKAIRQLKKIEELTDQEIRLAAEWSEKWKVLISTILSCQTRDETTIEISNRLYSRYDSVQKLAAAGLEDVKKLVKPVNYYKTKAKHVIETAKIIVDHYKGEVPKTREELLELPGVGRKVANVYLVQVYEAAAIGVDTHVAYLSQLLGWTKNKNPHKIEKDLERLFPNRYWNSINYILVRFGRIYGTRKRQREKLKEEKII